MPLIRFLHIPKNIPNQGSVSLFFPYRSISYSIGKTRWAGNTPAARPLKGAPRDGPRGGGEEAPAAAC